MFRTILISFKEGRDAYVAGERRWFEDEALRVTLEERGWISNDAQQVPAQSPQSVDLDINKGHIGLTGKGL